MQQRTLLSNPCQVLVASLGKGSQGRQALHGHKAQANATMQLGKACRGLARDCRQSSRAETRDNMQAKQTSRAGDKNIKIERGNTLIGHGGNINRTWNSITCFSMHRWSSGMIYPCHGCDPGSIPGRCNFLFLSLLYKKPMVHTTSRVDTRQSQLYIGKQRDKP